MFLLFSRLDNRFNCGIKGSEIPYGVHFSVTTSIQKYLKQKNTLKFILMGIFS